MCVCNDLCGIFLKPNFSVKPVGSLRWHLTVLWSSGMIPASAAGGSGLDHLKLVSKKVFDSLHCKQGFVPYEWCRCIKASGTKGFTPHRSSHGRLHAEIGFQNFESDRPGPLSMLPAANGRCLPHFVIRVQVFPRPVPLSKFWKPISA